MKDLQDLTLKILKTSQKFTSNDFIKAYNIIYLHCTEQTDNYEIRGRIVYTNLEIILTEYFKSMRPISSFESFYAMCVKLESSFDLLEKVYFYIERFFINVNINKKNENVCHLVNLFNKLLYKHYFYSCMSNIEEYFIYEICCIREGNIDEIDKLKKTSNFIKDLFTNIENEIEYEHFLSTVINSFNEGLKNENIENLIQKIILELKLTKEIFDFTQKKFYFEITKLIAQNFKKFLDWFFCRKIKNELNVKKSKIQIFQTQCLKDFNDIKIILYHMDDKYLVMFFSKFKTFLFSFVNSIGNIDDLFNFFIDFKETFSDRNIITDDLEKSIEKEIITKFNNFENLQDYFSFLITELITKYQTEDLDKRPEYIFYLINQIESKNLILKKLSKDCLQRIIIDTSKIFIEQKFIHLCETHCGSSSVSWLRLIVQMYNTPLKQNYGLSDQDADFNTEMRLITKGFCNLEISNINLHSKLFDLGNILKKRYMLRYPRSEINCCYPASSLQIEINNVNIRLSTDKVSLLLYLKDEANLEIVRLKSKDPLFDNNIKFLEDNKIIIISGKSAYINDKFTSGEKLLDLFDYKIKKKEKVENKPEDANFLETAVESCLMNYMKKLKVSKMKDIVKNIGIIFSNRNYNLEKIIDKLEEKGYLRKSNSDIYYIP